MRNSTTKKDHTNTREAQGNDLRALMDLLGQQHPSEMLSFHRMAYDAVIDTVGSDSKTHGVFRDLEAFFEKMAGEDELKNDTTGTREALENDERALMDLLGQQHPSEMLSFHRMAYDAVIDTVGSDSKTHGVYRDLEAFFEKMAGKKRIETYQMTQ